MLLRIVATLLVLCSTLNLSGGLRVKFPPLGYHATYNVLGAPAYHPGFFSAFFTVLGFLEDCERDERNGYSVDFGTEGAFYEPSKGSNWWTYYFASLEKQCAQRADKKFVQEEEKTYFSFNTLNHGRVEVNALINKYIRIHPEIQREVDFFDDTQIQSSPLIGVSFQRPDRIRAAANRDFSGFYSKIDGLLEDDIFFIHKIFVSTDDEEFLEKMISRYGERVIYRDVPRGDKVASAFYETLTPNYDRGFNELVDCLLLAKSETILKTNSHIATAAGFFNPQLDLVTIRTVTNRRRPTVR